MPRKNAKAWLIKDAQHAPLIPFFDVDGKILYRWSDLQHIAINVLGAAASAVRVQVPGTIERRGGEQRSRYERRIREEITLAPGIERRLQVTADRRQNNQRERRRSGNA